MAAQGQISRHVDDDATTSNASSTIKHPFIESRLRHHLVFSQKSLLLLHSQLRALQIDIQLLECKYDASKSEASFNASALREMIAEFSALKSEHDQLLKECERFQADRDVFAEVAEDAEERRAEADKKAVAAEVRAMEAELRYAKAEQKDRAARIFIQNLLTASTIDSLQILASPEVRERWGVDPRVGNMTTRKKNRAIPEHDQFLNSPDLDAPAKLDMSLTIKQVDSVDTVHSTLSTTCEDDRDRKMAYSDSCIALDESRKEIGKRSGDGDLESTVFHRIPFPSGKEKFDSFDAEARAKIKEAAYSDDQTNKYLASLLVTLERNLLKAEAEGDLIYGKYCEMRNLLFDTLATFGTQPEGRLWISSDTMLNKLKGVEEHADQFEDTMAKAM